MDPGALFAHLPRNQSPVTLGEVGKDRVMINPGWMLLASLSNGFIQLRPSTTGQKRPVGLAFCMSGLEPIALDQKLIAN